MKFKILIAVLLVLLTAGVVAYLKQQRFHVVIVQSQIDAALAKAFPVSKRYLLFLEITFSNPRAVLLEESDRVQVGLDASLSLRIADEPKDLGGNCVVTAGIRYNAETQEFFLADAQFDRLEVEGIPPKYLEQITAIASRAAAEFISKKPVYRLAAKDTKTTAAKLLLKGVQVKEQAIHLTLGL